MGYNGESFCQKIKSEVCENSILTPYKVYQKGVKKTIHYLFENIRYNRLLNNINKFSEYYFYEYFHFFLKEDGYDNFVDILMEDVQNIIEEVDKKDFYRDSEIVCFSFLLHDLLKYLRKYKNYMSINIENFNISVLENENKSYK